MPDIENKIKKLTAQDGEQTRSSGDSINVSIALSESESKTNQPLIARFITQYFIENPNAIKITHGHYVFEDNMINVTDSIFRFNVAPHDENDNGDNIIGFDWGIERTYAHSAMPQMRKNTKESTPAIYNYALIQRKDKTDDERPNGGFGSIRQVIKSFSINGENITFNEMPMKMKQLDGDNQRKRSEKKESEYDNHLTTARIVENIKDERDESSQDMEVTADEVTKERESQQAINQTTILSRLNGDAKREAKASNLFYKHLFNKNPADNNLCDYSSRYSADSKSHKYKANILMPDGGDKNISDLIKEGSLTLDEKIHIFYNMLVQAQVPIDNGSLHADLKPANFAVNPKTKHPMLVDFGGSLNKATVDFNKAADAPFTAAGTVLYFAPESDSGNSEATESYALGATGAELFGFITIDQVTADYQDNGQLFHDVLKEKSKHPNEITEDKEERDTLVEVKKILDKMLHPDSSSRISIKEAITLLTPFYDALGNNNDSVTNALNRLTRPLNWLLDLTLEKRGHNEYDWRHHGFFRSTTNKKAREKLGQCKEQITLAAKSARLADDNDEGGELAKDSASPSGAPGMGMGTTGTAA